MGLFVFNKDVIPNLRGYKDYTGFIEDFSGRTLMSTQSSSLQQLEHALRIAARVVVFYGETYIPIFNRLHDEVEKLKLNQDKENLAVLLAKQYTNME